MKAKERDLFYAINNGLIKDIELLIGRGVNINIRGLRWETPLIAASATGFYEVVKLLLEKGADINASDFEGQTALKEAVEWQRYEISKLLIENGADVNAVAQRGMTALMAAAVKGECSLVKLLIENRVNINAKDENGYTALFLAVTEANLSVIELLVNNGAILTARIDGRKTYASSIADPQFSSSLRKGSRADQEKIYQFLKHAERLALDNPQESCQEVDPQEINLTLLDAAREEKLQDVIEAVKKGADVNITSSTKPNETPLAWAVARENDAMVEFLVQNGAKKDLFYALRYGPIQLIESLIEKKEDLEVTNPLGDPPFIVAAKRNEKDILEFLIKKGADVNSKDLCGQTALLIATHINPSVDVVRFLIANGADLEAKDNIWGKTALKQASEEKQEEIVKALLDAGAKGGKKKFGRFF